MVQPTGLADLPSLGDSGHVFFLGSWDPSRGFSPILLGISLFFFGFVSPSLYLGSALGSGRPFVVSQKPWVPMATTSPRFFWVVRGNPVSLEDETYLKKGPITATYQPGQVVEFQAGCGAGGVSMRETAQLVLARPGRGCLVGSPKQGMSSGRLLLVCLLRWQQLSRWPSPESHNPLGYQFSDRPHEHVTCPPTTWAQSSNWRHRFWASGLQCHGQFPGAGFR